MKQESLSNEGGPPANVCV